MWLEDYLRLTSQFGYKNVILDINKHMSSGLIKIINFCIIDLLYIFWPMFIELGHLIGTITLLITGCYVITND